MRYSEQEIETLREGGTRHAMILQALARLVRPGVSTQLLEDQTRELLETYGDTAAFLGYTPDGADRPYPAALCTSVNDEAVHGIPNENPRILTEGDIVTIDLGLNHEGLITDSALTVPVGHVSHELQTLLRVSEEALFAGIGEARAGNTVGDIGAAVQAVVEGAGLTIVKELGGHGVGHTVHEEPFVPNYGKAGSGRTLQAGMVLALEPIVTTGSGEIFLDINGYTLKSVDGAPVAQFEHTIVITEGAAEILTDNK